MSIKVSKSPLFISTYRNAGVNMKGNSLKIGYTQSQSQFPYEASYLYHYGFLNNYPNELKKILSFSSSSLACASLLANYISANGFISNYSANLKVNNNQSADQILSHIAKEIVLWEGFALQVWTNLDNEVCKIELVPFELLRKATDGTFIYNETYNLNTPRISEKVEFRAYSALSDTDRLALGFQDLETYGAIQGEILYCQMPNTLFDGVYNYPNWASDIDTIIADFLGARFRMGMFKDGFMPSAIITLIDDNMSLSQTFDETNKGQPSETYQSQISNALDSIKGADNAAKILVNVVDNKDNAPIINSFDLKPVMDGTQNMTDSIDKRVCRVWGLDPAIMGLSEGGQLGNNQQLKMLIDILNNGKIKGYKDLIKTVFRMLYPTFNWDISTFNPLQSIDEQQLKVMTNDEIRAYFGLEVVANTNTKSNVDILNSLSPLVATKVLETLTPDEIRALGGYQPSTIAPNPNTNNA